jgi:transcriptional regulator with PAS, ATPase and Fis domain
MFIFETHVKVRARMMDKIKILAIAPYDALKDLINDVAFERKDLEVHCFVSDMLDGMEIAKSIQHKGYDAIISRAGTAELIREVSNLPVIDIKLSVIDMMRTIKLAQNYSGKFVIIGYKSITDTANIICELLQYDVEIITISDISEIDNCLSELKKKGVSLIVGDVITVNHAKVIGLNTILVTSGKKSVLNSFDEVIRLHKTILVTQQKNALIRDILDKSNVSAISYNLDKRIIYSSIKEDIDDYKKILGEIESLTDALLREKKIKIIKKLGTGLVSIRGELLEFKDSTYPTFYLENQGATVKPFDDAISYKNISDSPQVNFETFSTSSDLLKSIIKNAKAYAAIQTPIIIYGNKGTGKDTIAHTIYHNSNYNKNPLVIINSKFMNEKKWISTFESDNSIFTNTNFTIYIKNLHCMDEASQKLFESYILNTSVHKRNRFIFSCISGYSKSFDCSTLLYFIRNELNALPLIMPNLNQRSEDIPSLASLYLSDLNLKYGKQVIGLDNDATKLLQEYNWINNIDQFKRVIEELIILTDTFYINPETVKKVLSYEILPKSYTHMSSLDLNKSLDEINKDIINLVLNEEDFNQSKVAARLGISRSTLWRKIK